MAGFRHVNGPPLDRDSRRAKHHSLYTCSNHARGPANSRSSGTNAVVRETESTIVCLQLGRRATISFQNRNPNYKSAKGLKICEFSWKQAFAAFRPIARRLCRQETKDLQHWFTFWSAKATALSPRSEFALWLSGAVHRAAPLHFNAESGQWRPSAAGSEEQPKWRFKPSRLQFRSPDRPPHQSVLPR